MTAPNEGCGGETDKYNWVQDDDEVCVTISLPSNTLKASDLIVKIERQSVHASVRGCLDPLINGPLMRAIDSELSSWSIERDRGDVSSLVLHLFKRQDGHEDWWPGVIEGDDTIDVDKLVPPPKSIYDLDEKAQASIAKMMFDQEQQRKGAPTSDQLAMQAALAKAGMPPNMMPPLGGSTFPDMELP